MTSSMMKSARAMMRWLVGETSGAEIAEAAAVLPIMFMMLLGIFWFGQAFRIYGTITRAAQDGARAAVTPVCTTCASGNTPDTNAYNAIQADMVAAGLDPNQMQQPATTPTQFSCVTGAALACDATPGNVCVQEPIQLSNSVAGGTGICGLAVSFQYPYQFWLPFTSLNKQTILLRAAARMRLETL